MIVNDFIITERPGERTKAVPNGIRVHMGRDYAADLAARLTAQLAENTGDVDVVLLGELLED